MERSADDQAWFLKSSCPVLLPPHDALTKSQADFDAFIAGDLEQRHDTAMTGSNSPINAEPMIEGADTETFTVITDSTTAEIRQDLAAMDVDTPEPAQGSHAHPFIQGLVAHTKEHDKSDVPNMENKMMTANCDITNRSTTSNLVDLLAELEDVVTAPRLRNILEAAWAEDPLVTLKIIFNARSIHLGKSSKSTFYRAAGWLATTHPLTLIANLRWLSRPVIEKKVRKDDDEDVVLVEKEQDEDDPSRFDIKHGVAHGYWKDLLNLLALAVNGKLNYASDPRDVLNSENPGISRGKSISNSPGKKSRPMSMARSLGRGRGRGASIISGRVAGATHFDYGRGRGIGRGRGRGGGVNRDSCWEQSVETNWEQPAEEQKKKLQLPKADEARKERRDTRGRRHAAAVEAFNTNAIYRALHLTVARLFAEQLQTDVATLRGKDAKAKKTISLCGKWAPSHDRFHDRHTFIVSSIAEIMYPRESLDNLLSSTDSREIYLRYAREEYRKDISALRKHLDVVERDITAKTYNNIKYERLPSLAMSNYSKLFIEKDFDRFEKYLDRVAEGKANISGATLMPSTMIQNLRTNGSSSTLTKEAAAKLPPNKLIEHKAKMLELRTIDGQWNALVQRIKDSGTLSSSIAVCDVSGSMSSPRFPDETCPMDSAIGLSLLVAEVTQAPFGGTFITFSANPVVEKVDLSKPIVEKVLQLQNAQWDMNTDFVAVFEDLILPMAIKNKLKQEDMVKRIFVFSDMQFDSAERQSRRSWSDFTAGETGGTWESSYEHIKKKYAKAGYEMPELIFWNLAGGRSSYAYNNHGEPIAPKPVTTTDKGTSLVSGYSQGMLKMFLENGSFEEEEESEDEVVVTKEEDGETVTSAVPKKKVKMDPLRTVKKAIGHKAYDMLRVMD